MNITVYCGAHSGSDPEFTARARELGVWMASNGHRLVYGAGNDGMMGAISHAVISNGGETTGVTPAFFIEAEETRDDLTELIVAPDMPSRRDKMIELGDAFIALPGGTGTLDEITEVMAIKRLGRLGSRNKPIILYNVNGYYDDFFRFLDRMAENDFCRKSDRDNFINAVCLADIISALAAAGEHDHSRNLKYD